MSANNGKVIHEKEFCPEDEGEMIQGSFDINGTIVIKGTGENSHEGDEERNASISSNMIRSRSHFSFVTTYLKRLRGAGEMGPTMFNPTADLIPTFILSSGIMIVLGAIEVYGLEAYGLQTYLPSFGASCALTVCLTTAPGAQPSGLLGTHFLGALLGISFGHATKSIPQPLGRLLASSFAVACLSAISSLLGCFQPSSSATAVLAAFHNYGEMNDEGYMFLVTPVFLGVTIIFFISWLMNNLIPWRPAYPVWW